MANNEEVMEVVHTWPHMQAETFFTDGIMKFADKRNKCMKMLGDYIKKWQYICSCLPFVG